jgi:putative sterol carrier protein
MTPKDFLSALPGKVNNSVLEGLETRFHFDLTGQEGTQTTVTVEKGEIQVEEGLIGDPKCIVKADAENFISAVTGKLNPMMAILTGKIKISNQGEMLKYAKIFGLM